MIAGCPVADGLPACPRCEGWYRITSAKFTEALCKHIVIPDRLCGPMKERAEKYYAENKLSKK
jgi:hypothetical protein